MDIHGWLDVWFIHWVPARCPTPEISSSARKYFSHAQAEKSCDKGKPSQQPRAICLTVVLLVNRCCQSYRYPGYPMDIPDI
jgi:hypothetical protein